MGAFSAAVLEKTGSPLIVRDDIEIPQLRRGTRCVPPHPAGAQLLPEERVSTACMCSAWSPDAPARRVCCSPAAPRPGRHLGGA